MKILQKLSLNYHQIHTLFVLLVLDRPEQTMYTKIRLLLAIGAASWSASSLHFRQICLGFSVIPAKVLVSENSKPLHYEQYENQHVYYEYDSNKLGIPLSDQSWLVLIRQQRN